MIKSSNKIILHNKNKKKFGFNRLAVSSIKKQTKRTKRTKKQTKFGKDIGIGIGSLEKLPKKSKSFIENITSFLLNSDKEEQTQYQDQNQDQTQHQDQENYKDTVKDPVINDLGPEYDEILGTKYTREPFNVIPYHTTDIKTVVVIIGPQNLYLHSDQSKEFLIKTIDMINLGGDRITGIYNILFSNDIVDNAKIYSGTHFLVPDLLTDTEKQWSKITKTEPTFIMFDNHLFKSNQILQKIYKDLLEFDKIIVASFLEAEQDIFIKELLSSMTSIGRRLTMVKDPKIIILKDLDTDLIQQGLDPRVNTLSVSRALYNDYWTSDMIKSKTRYSWTNPPDLTRYADPEITEYNKSEAKSIISKRSRLHNGPAFTFNKEGFPLNPFKKEYMFSGRGSLPYFGPNFDTYIILSRQNNYDQNGFPVLEILVKSRPDYDLIHYMDSIDIILNYLYKKMYLMLYQDSSKLLYEGPVVDDPRSTKNAWVEAAVYNWNLSDSHKEMRLDRVNYEWIDIKKAEELIDFNDRKEILNAIKKLKNTK